MRAVSSVRYRGRCAERRPRPSLVVDEAPPRRIEGVRVERGCDVMEVERGRKGRTVKA